MKTLTAHDVLGTIEGLQNYADALHEAATSEVVDVPKRGTGVLVDPVPLAEMAIWMLAAAEELLRSLIPDMPIEVFKDNRRVRTLVRVVGHDSENHTGQVVLPGWDPEAVITIPLPGSICVELDAMSPTPLAPVRLHAWVNLGALAADELVFDDWEWS